MAWFPWVAQIAGTVQQGRAAQSAGNANAAALAGQSFAARDQAAAEEARIRREARMQQGRLIAATGESGGGYGGSAGSLLRQSQLFAELDALNTRYQGDLRARGLLAQSVAERRSGKQGRNAGNLLAGAKLLQGYS